MTKPRVKAFLTVLFMVFWLLALKAFAGNEPTAQGLSFTILHTNDLHAHDESFSDRGRIIGGMPRIAHIIRAMKAQNPNVLAIDAGDIFQGTPFFKFYHGQVEVDMLNDAGYDLYTIGNHEFDDGPANLAKQLKNAHFPIISANLDASAVPELAALVKPSVIKTINGQKVAFIGAVVPNLTEVSLRTEGVKLKATGDQWMEPIKQEIQRIKSEGINKIILVTHCGVELDRQLAQLPDVDVIVGGHSHTRLEHGIVVDHPDGSHCIIVQTGCYGRALGKLELSFDKDGNIDTTKTSSRLINITDRIHDEPDIAAYLKEKEKPFLKMRTTVVSKAAGDFDNAFRTTAWDSALGDLIADALADGGTKYGATIAFQNRGGIRGRIDAGPITEEKIDELLPFENHLIVASIKGDALLKTLENSIAGEGLGSKFLDVHGIKFAYDRNKAPFHRLIWALTCGQNGEWKPIDPKATYRIAINDYSFKGGEGYDFSDATDIKDTGSKLSVYFQNYLSHHPVVAPALPSRIIPVNSDLASIDNRASKLELVIKSPAAGARVIVLRGFGKDICAIANRVPVPLKQPKVISSTKLTREQTELHVLLPTEKNGGANLEYAAVVMPANRMVPISISPALNTH